MKKLIAVYKGQRGGKSTQVMEKDTYKSKQAFAEDLRGNGFAVVAIFNEKDVATFKSKPSYLYTKKDDLLENVLQNL